MLKLSQNIKLYFCISIAVISAPIYPNKAKAMETYISDCATQILCFLLKMFCAVAHSYVIEFSMG